jgi:spore coat protein H
MKWKCKSDPVILNLNLKFFISVILFSSLISPDSNSQQIQKDDYKLSFTYPGKKIENTISFYTSKSGYETIEATTGKKIKNIETFLLIINEDTLYPEKISTRGQTTLYYRRKSFSFDLKSKALFRHGERTEPLKKFFALSLSMDRNYCNNRLAFEMMETTNLFSLFYSFCELRINGQSEGIYMVIERPDDWAMKKKDSPLLIRRGYNHNIDKIVTEKSIEKSETKKYCTNYNLIYKCLIKYDGEELYETLSNWLDINSYMKWLAFNFFVRNGDYTDEVYFYFDPGINKFNILPWDYDDLFHPAPHEGNIENKKLLTDKLIFSAEDQLDKKIAADPYLHKIYLNQLGVMLDQLSPEVLRKVFENTYTELYPYYSTNEIINMSDYDAYKNANITKLQNDLSLLYQQLRISRDYYLDLLKSR